MEILIKYWHCIKEREKKGAISSLNGNTEWRWHSVRIGEKLTKIERPPKTLDES